MWEFKNWLYSIFFSVIFIYCKEINRIILYTISNIIHDIQSHNPSAHRTEPGPPCKKAYDEDGLVSASVNRPLHGYLDLCSALLQY